MRSDGAFLLQPVALRVKMVAHGKPEYSSPDVQAEVLLKLRMQSSKKRTRVSTLPEDDTRVVDMGNAPSPPAPRAPSFKYARTSPLWTNEGEGEGVSF